MVLITIVALIAQEPPTSRNLADSAAADAPAAEAASTPAAAGAAAATRHRGHFRCVLRRNS